MIRRKCCTDLHTYQIWELQRYIQYIPKILQDSHSLTISSLEDVISGTIPSELLDKTQSIGVLYMVWSGDLGS